MFFAAVVLSDGACEIRKHTVRQEEGVIRLITPAVVNQTKQHFTCYNQSEFGGPLEVIVRFTIQTLIKIHNHFID